MSDTSYINTVILRIKEEKELRIVKIIFFYLNKNILKFHCLKLSVKRMIWTKLEKHISVFITHIMMKRKRRKN